MRGEGRLWKFRNRHNAQGEKCLKIQCLEGFCSCMVGVQNFEFSGYMTVSGLCMHDFGKFWKIMENFLLFTKIPTEKMRIRKHTVPNHIWCHIHAKFRGLKSHLITSESHPRITSGQNSEASHIRVSHPQSHPDKIQSLPSQGAMPLQPS